MPFIPHTEQDLAHMLETLEVSDLQALFDEIPESLRLQAPLDLLPALDEASLARLMQMRAKRDEVSCSFLGAGAYDHYIPAAVWDIVGRGEFMTAYTPYQAEASQGTLQVIYEYQSMMCRLTGMPVSNASLYDGASALAEALLMSVRGNKKNRSNLILVPENLHPHYRDVCQSLIEAQGLRLETVPFNPRTGLLDVEGFAAFAEQQPTAIVLNQPNFFGGVETPDPIVDWAHAQKALVIAVVNPISLALLKPPAEWGEKGADIVVGEGQPLGVPISSGGPYFGFMCTTKALVRQMPGRIIGRTVDTEGRLGYTLTLQAREQHIRRAKATSNICTNQGLAVTAATIYMSLMGPAGLRGVASQSHAQLRKAVSAVTTAVPSIEKFFVGQPCFHEAVLRLPVPAQQVADRLADQGILPGLPLAMLCPQLPGAEFALLICATEKHTDDDIQSLALAMSTVISELQSSEASSAPQSHSSAQDNEQEVSASC